MKSVIKNKTFQKIGIMGRVNSPHIKDTLNKLIVYLKQLPLSLTIVIEDETKELIDDKSLATIHRDNLAEHCDLLIVTGGDGSLLHAACLAVAQSLPVLGINRGSLGFLTDILPTEFEKIAAILQGNYILEERFLLTGLLQSEDKIIAAEDALNEIAIIPDTIPHMIEFEIYIDDEFVCSQNSDGLIIATPTGSTAYALSGGGPILHPQLDAIVLVPMFPHALNNRPIVIEGSRTITIFISLKNKTTPRVICDGRAFKHILPGSHLTIAKKNKMLKLLHPTSYNYYQALRSKLHWGKKLRYNK